MRKILCFLLLFCLLLCFKTKAKAFNFAVPDAVESAYVYLGEASSEQLSDKNTDKKQTKYVIKMKVYSQTGRASDIPLMIFGLGSEVEISMIKTYEQKDQRYAYIFSERVAATIPNSWIGDAILEKAVREIGEKINKPETKVWSAELPDVRFNKQTLIIPNEKSPFGLYAYFLFAYEAYRLKVEVTLETYERTKGRFSKWGSWILLVTDEETSEIIIIVRRGLYGD